MTLTISIVVPIYKVEPYLPTCLNSILNQTYKNLEIILVDDGSPDGCSVICEEYARKDQRIKVIHQKNAGVSAARNAGIKVASGDYLVFVDSDDALHTRMVEILYKNILETKADISVCDLVKVTELAQKDKPIGSEQITVVNKLAAMQNLYDRKWYLPTVVAWNKLYRKELFQNVRYPVGRVHEDEFVIHHLLDQANTIVYSDAPLYYYLQRTTGITGEPYSLNRLHKVEALKERMLFFQEKGYKHLYNQAYKQYLDILRKQYRQIRKYYPEKEEIYKQLRTDFINTRFPDSDFLPLKTRARYTLFSVLSFFDIIAAKIWRSSKKASQTKENE